MAWTIEYKEQALRQLRKMDKQAAKQLVGYLEKRVAVRDDPRTLGKPLVGSELGGLWRYRVQDYRVICELQDEKLVVLVLKVGRRDKIYD